MATHSNIRIKRESIEGIKCVDVPIAKSTVIAPGDLISLSGGTDAVVYTSGLGLGTFLGVALEGSTSSDIAPISVARECVIRGKLDSASGAAATLGKALAYKAGANGTDWTFQTTGATYGLAFANEAISKGSFGEIYIDTQSIATGSIFY